MSLGLMSHGWSWWWPSGGVGEAGDFTEVFEVASAVLAGEGFGFGEFRWSFGALAEEVTNFLARFFSSAGVEAVVADAGEAFGEDVEEPAPNKLVWVEVEDAVLFSGGVGPEEFDVSLGVVAEEALWVEGAAVDVSREVAQGGFTLADVLELDVPFCARSEGAALVDGEFLVNLGVVGFEGAVDEAAEAGGEGKVVDEEFFGVLRADEFVVFLVERDGGDDAVDVGMVLHLASPGVEDAGDAEFK